MQFLMQVTYRGKLTFKTFVSQDSWKVLLTPSSKLASNHKKKKIKAELLLKKKNQLNINEVQQNTNNIRILLEKFSLLIELDV